MRGISGPSGKLLATLAILCVMVWAAAVGAPVESTRAGPPVIGDLELYRLVAEHVAAGEGYYRSVVELHRYGDYPLQPASTVRFPTMAYISGLIEPVHLTVGLLLANMLVWIALFPGNAIERALAGIMLALGGFMAFDPEMAYLHDLSAGLLLSLALALHSEKRWWPSWLLVLFAVAVREHAILFGAVFGACALYRRKWPEVVAWIFLGIAFLGATAVHYLEVNQLVGDGDKASDGWLWLLGPKAFLNDILALTLLRLLPMWIAGPLALLPFIGWAIVRDKKPLLVFASYALLFCFVGRENNYYWGFLVLPAYLAGLALVPRAMVQFWRNDRKMVGADGLEPPTLSV